MSKKANWGDEDDEGEQNYETKVDSKGQKLRVRTKVNSKGQTIRVTTTLKVNEVKVRMPKRVLERRNLPRFGDAVAGEANVTLPSKDYIMMEHPDDSLVEDAEDNAMSTLTSFILKQQERQLEREHDLGDFEDDEALEKAAAEAANGGSGSSGDGGDAPSSSAGGLKYVPPSARGAGGVRTAFPGASSSGEGENTLRVSNLTKAVTEDDLRELFCRYGRISRISLPKMEKKDEQGNIYKEPKGFAYIAFMNRADAEVAMNELNGHGYDHLILKIEWAKAPDGNAMSSRSGLSGGFVSGYGERLAQDTKEKVSFASNLSDNK